MLEEIETEETRGFFVAFLSFKTFQSKVRGGTPGYAYVLGSLFLDIRKLSATLEAEFNSLVVAGMGSKPFGTKAAVIFAFRE